MVSKFKNMSHKAPTNNSIKPFKFFFKCVLSTSSFFLGLVIQKECNNSYLEAAGDRNGVLEH